MTEHATHHPALLPRGPLYMATAGFLSRYPAGTRETYTSDLAHFFGWCASNGLEPLEAKRPHLELYLRCMTEQQGYATSTVAKRASTVRCFYRACVWDDILPASPAEHLRRPRVSRDSARLGLDRRELTAYLAESRDAGPTEWALAALCGILGLRVSEACALDLEHFGERGGHRTVTVHGKGSRVDTIPLPPPVARAVDAAVGDRTTGPLLLRRGGTRLTRVAAYRIVQRVATKAGITHHISPHSLRHAACTNMLDAGCDLRDVQVAMRHSDPATTVYYDRNRKVLDRHSSYALAAWVATAS